MSDSNRVSLIYVPEVTYGTTPVDDAGWKTVRDTGETMSASTTVTESAERRTDRMLSDNPLVGLSVGGNGFPYELSGTTYDDFIEAVMCGTWTTNALIDDFVKIGTTDRSFSFEKNFGDLTNKYINFTGMRATAWSMSLAWGSIITGDFTFMGNGADATGVASKVGAGSLAAATTTDVMNASADVGTIKFDGVASNICINSLNFTVDNNGREINCLGSIAASDINKGSASVTGSFEAYLDDDSFDFYVDSLSNTAFSMEYTVTDGTYSYTFFFPKVKAQVDAPTAGSKDTDVMTTVNFTALYDVTEDSSFTVRRTPQIP